MLRGFAVRLRALLRREAAERELDEELRYHLDREGERNLARGMTSAEAERAARRAFGNVSAVKDQARDSWGWVRLEHLMQDLRFAGRQLRRAPLLTGLAVVTFGLGIGAAVTIATVANVVLLKPLPFDNPGRLVLLTARSSGSAGGRLLSYPDVVDLAARIGGSARTAAYAPVGTWNLLWQQPDGQQPVGGTFVSSNLFDVLQPSMALGRAFSADDPPSVAVVSDAFWRRKLRGDPGVIGTSMAFPAPYTIVGVLAPGVRLGEEVDVWLPLAPGGVADWGPDRRAFEVVGRLEPGASIASVVSGLASGGTRFQVVDLHQALVGDIRPQLLLLLAAVCAVTVLGGVNVSTLLLDRAVSREREMALRVALGATGTRVATQLMTESAVLAIMGGAVGVLLAAWCLGVLRQSAPPSLARLHQIPFDASFVIAALGFTTLCAVLAGLLPVRRSRRATTPLLGSAPVAGRREERRVRRTLAVIQVGFAFSLLVVAGLMIRSLRRVLAVDLGFRPEGVLAVQLSSDLADVGERLGFYQRLFDQVRELPGVSAVAASTRLPLREGGSARVELEQEARQEAGGVEVEVRRASRDYFRTMGITVVTGRAFSSADRVGSPGVVIVNRTAAARLWPGGDPIGRRLRLVRPGQGAPWLTVVGVVGDVRHFGLEVDPRPEVYLCFEQGPPFGALLLTRTSGTPELLAAPIRQVVRTLDPEAAVVDVIPVERLLADALAPRRYTVWLLSMFGGLAIVLAFIGVYATVSHVMTGRRREVAVRMSLGATPPGILRMALMDAVWYALPGLALGGAAGVGAGRLLGSLLVGVDALDPLTFLAVSAGCGATVALAALVPALRAAHLDPAAVLRSE